MIAPNSRARKVKGMQRGEKEDGRRGGKKRGTKRGKVMGEYGGIGKEEEGNADYGRMVQPSQQHVVPCVKA